MRIILHQPLVFRACWFVAICALFALAVSGCAPASTQGEPAQSSSGSARIEELPSQPEYIPPDPASRGKVHVQVPDGYKFSGYMEDIEPYTGKKVELEATLVDLGDVGSLQIIVDDAGFFDWYYSGSAYGTSTVYEYVERAVAAGQGSSWPVKIGGAYGVVFIDGSADAGGEMSGQAFVFLDGATVAISAVLPDGETAPDAYSALFRSDKVASLLSELVLTAE